MQIPEKLPPKFGKYFWDVDAAKLNPQKRPRYIIERLLEYGDINALKWMEEKYGEEKIKDVTRQSNQLSRKSANFFGLIYNIPDQEIRCLQKDSHNKPKTIWPH